MPVTLSGYFCMLCKRALKPNTDGTMVRPDGNFEHVACRPVFPGSKITEREHEKSVAKKMEAGLRLVEVPSFPTCEACGGAQYKLNDQLQCPTCITERVRQDRLFGRGDFAPKPKGEKRGKTEKESGSRVRARRVGRTDGQGDDRSLF